MKTRAPTILLTILIWHAVSMWYACAQTGEDPQSNLLNNPGFEETMEVDMTKVYPMSEDYGIRLPKGNPALMPANTWLNFGEGWATHSSGKEFEYLQGTPGKETHTGHRAIKIISPGSHSGIVVGEVTPQHSVKGSIPVLREAGPGDDGVQFDKAHKFVFYAKGAGSVMVTTYCYDIGRTGIYNKPGLREVKPENIPVMNEDEWQKYEGTVKIVNPDVHYIYFVLRVQGEIWLDDVALYAK